MKRTVRIADKLTADKIKYTVEGSALKLDNITKILESGGVLGNPDFGLEAIKNGLDEAKKSVSDGKAKVAAAIAAKGVATNSEATFDTLASNIGKLVMLSSGSADATAGAAQILKGYTAYAKGSKVTGSIQSLGTQTITPGTANKTIAANQYLSGIQTIAGDVNLLAANIKKGISIFGVPGNYEGATNSVSYDVEYTVKSSTSIELVNNSITLPFTPTVLLLYVQMLWSSTTLSSPISSMYVSKPLGQRVTQGANSSVNVSDSCTIALSGNTVTPSGTLYASFQNSAAGPRENPTNSKAKIYAIA